MPMGNVNPRSMMDSPAPQIARMRPDPSTARYLEISTAHKCPPGYGEGPRTTRLPASGSAPGEPSKACPESCTDILADQERRSRERRQLEAHPGDFKIGEPKICPPGYPSEHQPGGMQNAYSSGPSGKGIPGGVPAKMCQPKFPMEQAQHKQGGMGARDPKSFPPKHAAEKQPGMAMGGAHPAMGMSDMADPKMCPPQFSVGLSPDSDIAQDPRCAVDYQKCAPKKNPNACETGEMGHPLGSREKTKSRELIGGVLLTGCDCVKRNGLQHDCKRSLCQGRPECLTNPPMCLPSGGPGCIPASYFES